MISIYKIAQHHNVVRLEDYFENRDNFYLCLELHSDQSLAQFILKNKHELEEFRARELILKIGQALDYLHDQGIILKNLSADGILMTDVTSNVELQRAVPRIKNLSKAKVMGYNDYQRGLEGDV